MKKLSPFCIGCTRRRFFGFRGVNKLKDKGSTGDNPLTAWKKVSSDYPKGIKYIRCWELDSGNSIRFQDTRLARGLTADLLYLSAHDAAFDCLSKKYTYHNQLRHVKLPTFTNVSIPYTREHVILHTKIAECILKSIDEIYQVLVHFQALDIYSRSSTRWFGYQWVRVGSRDLTPFGNCICSCCFPMQLNFGDFIQLQNSSSKKFLAIPELRFLAHSLTLSLYFNNTRELLFSNHHVD